MVWPTLNEREWVNIPEVVFDTITSLTRHIREELEAVVLEQQSTITALQRAVLEQRETLKALNDHHLTLVARVDSEAEQSRMDRDSMRIQMRDSVDAIDGARRDLLAAARAEAETAASKATVELERGVREARAAGAEAARAEAEALAKKAEAESEKRLQFMQASVEAVVTKAAKEAARGAEEAKEFAKEESAKAEEVSRKRAEVLDNRVGAVEAAVEKRIVGCEESVAAAVKEVRDGDKARVAVLDAVRAEAGERLSAVEIRCGIPPPTETFLGSSSSGGGGRGVSSEKDAGGVSGEGDSAGTSVADALRAARSSSTAGGGGGGRGDSGELTEEQREQLRLEGEMQQKQASQAQPPAPGPGSFGTGAGGQLGGQRMHDLFVGDGIMRAVSSLPGAAPAVVHAAAGLEQLRHEFSVLWNRYHARRDDVSVSLADVVRDTSLDESVTTPYTFAVGQREMLAADVEAAAKGHADLAPRVGALEETAARHSEDQKGLTEMLTNTRADLDVMTDDVRAKLETVASRSKTADTMLNQFKQQVVATEQRMQQSVSEAVQPLGKIRRDLDDVVDGLKVQSGKCTQRFQTFLELRSSHRDTADSVSRIETNTARIGREIETARRDAKVGLDRMGDRVEAARDDSRLALNALDAALHREFESLKREMTSMVSEHPSHARVTEARFFALEQRLKTEENFRLSQQMCTDTVLEEVVKVVDRQTKKLDGKAAKRDVRNLEQVLQPLAERIVQKLLFSSQVQMEGPFRIDVDGPSTPMQRQPLPPPQSPQRHHQHPLHHPRPKSGRSTGQRSEVQQQSQQPPQQQLRPEPPNSADLHRPAVARPSSARRRDPLEEEAEAVRQQLSQTWAAGHGGDAGKKGILPRVKGASPDDASDPPLREFATKPTEQRAGDTAVPTEVPRNG